LFDGHEDALDLFAHETNDPTTGASLPLVDKVRLLLTMTEAAKKLGVTRAALYEASKSHFISFPVARFIFP
jgi:hypothetical protein